jgi:hypothetical protein
MTQVRKTILGGKCLIVLTFALAILATTAQPMMGADQGGLQ